MQKRNVFLFMLMKRFVRANRIRAAHPPTPPRLSTPKRPGFGLALKTSLPAIPWPCPVRARLNCSKHQPHSDEARPHKRFLALGVKIVVVGLALFLGLPAQAGVREVG